MIDDYEHPDESDGYGCLILIITIIAIGLLYYFKNH